MKIIADTSKDTLSSAKVESTNFTCEASPQMFQILTDKIYGDPITSLVRELISNAHDSHVQAGTSETPIDVHVPNSLEPVFSVRDYGVSMSEEDIKTVYTVFFRSSKNDSNEQIGGFGLGAKLPFAYTNQFTVTTFLNDTKTVYLACKENGLPVLKKVLSTPSTEPKGVLVEVPVANGDESYFISALRRFSQYSTFNMKYSDMSVYTPRTIATGIQSYVDQFSNNIKIYETPSCNDIFVRLGGVAYEINLCSDLIEEYHIRNAVERHIKGRHTNGCSWDICRLQTGYSMVLDFPVGSLQPTASRETLQLTEKDKRKLVYQIESLRIHLRKFITEQAEQLTTLVKTEYGKTEPHINSLKDWVDFQKKFNKLNRSLCLKSLWSDRFFKEIRGIKREFRFDESISYNTKHFISEDVRNCRVLYDKNGKIKQSQEAEISFSELPYKVYLTKLPISHIVESSLAIKIMNTKNQFCVLQVKQKVDLEKFVAQLKSKIGEEEAYFSFSELPSDFQTYREKKERNSSVKSIRVSKDEKLERYKTEYEKCFNKWGKILFVCEKSDNWMIEALEYFHEEVFVVSTKRDLEYVAKNPEVFEQLTAQHPIFTQHKQEIIKSYVSSILFGSYTPRMFVGKYKDKLTNKKIVELYDFYDNGEYNRISRLAKCHCRLFPHSKYTCDGSRALLRLLTPEEVMLFVIENSCYTREIKKILKDKTFNFRSNLLQCG